MSRTKFRTAAIFVLAAGVVTGCATDDRQTRAPSTQPLADLAAPDADRQRIEQFTGTLEGGMMAIGAETTGWRLVGDGESGALMVDVTDVQQHAQALQGQRVNVTGTVETRDFVERGKLPVLVAHRIQPAEQK